MNAFSFNCTTIELKYGGAGINATHIDFVENDTVKPSIWEWRYYDKDGQYFVLEFNSIVKIKSGGISQGYCKYYKLNNSGTETEVIF